MKNRIDTYSPNNQDNEQRRKAEVLDIWDFYETGEYNKTINGYINGINRDNFGSVDGLGRLVEKNVDRIMILERILGRAEEKYNLRKDGRSSIIKRTGDYLGYVPGRDDSYKVLDQNEFEFPERRKKRNDTTFEFRRIESFGQTLLNPNPYKDVPRLATTEHCALVTSWPIEKAREQAIKCPFPFLTVGYFHEDVKKWEKRERVYKDSIGKIFAETMKKGVLPDIAARKVDSAVSKIGDGCMRLKILREEYTRELVDSVRKEYRDYKGRKNLEIIESTIKVLSQVADMGMYFAMYQGVRQTENTALWVELTVLMPRQVEGKTQYQRLSKEYFNPPRPLRLTRRNGMYDNDHMNSYGN